MMFVVATSEEEDDEDEESVWDTFGLTRGLMVILGVVVGVGVGCSEPQLDEEVVPLLPDLFSLIMVLMGSLY